MSNKKKVAVDRAVATIKQSTRTDAEKVTVAGTLAQEMAKSANWAAATDVQAAVKAWTSTTTALGSNAQTISGLRAQLAEEYNRADAFCLPSVQEGFGIVLLEAMAAGKPIVASRAAAIPEVAPHSVLVEPDNAEALATGIERLFVSPPAPSDWVEQFDAPLVARRFLEAVSDLR